jgi:hypothetical protein
MAAPIDAFNAAYRARALVGLASIARPRMGRKAQHRYFELAKLVDKWESDCAWTFEVPETAEVPERILDEMRSHAELIEAVSAALRPHLPWVLDQIL